MEEGPEKRKLDDLESDSSGVAKKQATADNKVSSSSESEANVPPITVNMSCPQAKVGPLIGKKGVVIQEIMRLSGCKIQIDQNFPEGVPRQVQLTGNPKALSMAMQLVAQVLENVDASGVTQPNYAPFLPTSSLQQSPADEELMCPPDKVGAVIGQKGANINEIMRRTGCKIQIVQSGVPDGCDRPIQFTGTATQVEEAKALVKAVINEGGSALNLTPPPPGTVLGNGQTVVEDDISPDKVRFVIGVKGATVNQISKQSGCKILVNQKFPPGEPHKIIYTGTSQQIEIAKYMVETVLTKGPSHLLSPSDHTVMQEMNVFQSQMVRLLGPHGANVSDVQGRCGVKINIDTTPVMLMGNNIGPSGFAEATNKVTVIGNSESVQHAVKMLYEFIGIIVAAPPTPPMGAQLQQQQQQHQPQHQLQQQSSGMFQQQQQAQYQQQMHQQQAQPPQMMMMVPPGSYGAPPMVPPTYGAPVHQLHPPVNNVGYVPVPMMQSTMAQSGGAPGAGMMMPPGYPQLSPPVPMAGPILALGEDGTAGQLEAVMQLMNGSFQQIAEIKSHAVSRLTGKQNSNIALITSKSGANVQLMKADPIKGSTKIFLTAATTQALSLASQMVQEVLVNGITKLQSMPDVPPSPVAPPMIIDPSTAAPLMGTYYTAAAPGLPGMPGMPRPPMMYGQPPPMPQQIPYMMPQPGMMYAAPQPTQPQQQRPLLPQNMYGSSTYHPLPNNNNNNNNNGKRY